MVPIVVRLVNGHKKSEDIGIHPDNSYLDTLEKPCRTTLRPKKAIKTLRHAIYLDRMNLKKNLNLTIFVTILNITEYTHCDPVYVFSYLCLPGLAQQSGF